MLNKYYCFNSAKVDIFSELSTNKSHFFMRKVIIRHFSFDSLKKIINFEADYNKNLGNMEELKKKNGVDMSDKEIVFSQSIKAGKRIYYLDVKKNRKDEMFLAITESKKIVTGEGDDSQVSFEKHKIFLYKEDFEKFMAGLQQAIQFIQQEQGETTFSDTTPENSSSEANSAETKQTAKPDSSTLEGEIKIDIDF